jgi:outer membrane immunogenic protein
VANKISCSAIVAAALLWSGSAIAEGCHKGPFNGLYIGATVGYANLDSGQSPLGEPKLSNDDGGVIVGGHVGYNLQCGRVVVGVEGDLSYLDLETRGQQPDLTSFHSSVDMLGTLRGRLGLVVHDNILLYATAGVAWADRTHTLDAPGAPGGPFTQSDSDTATGWVVGGGIEFMRYDRWTLRGEVLWTDLGDESRTYVVSTGCGGVCEAHARWDDEIVTARIGLSLKLGGHEPHYQPLK